MRVIFIGMAIGSVLGIVAGSTAARYVSTSIAPSTIGDQQLSGDNRTLAI